MKPRKSYRRKWRWKELINNVIILNDSDYDRIETKFPNDLIIEAQLKDDGEIKNAVVEIIDTKSGKDAYYLEAYLQWLLHYNREPGGTVKKIAPEVEKLVQEAIKLR